MKYTKKTFLIVFSTLVIPITLIGKKSGRPAKTLHWDWNAINVHNLNFPKGFLWGSATSALQVEGNCTNTDWHDWEKSFDAFGKPREEHKVGKAVDQWRRYKEDIAIMAELGLNSYRFSLDWGKIQPTEKTFNNDALDHYEDLCKELVAHGIKPVITLHHFVNPSWFAQKGGFENNENIPYFVKFCQKVFERLHPYTHLWLTFNSPSSYVIKAYWQAQHPPAKSDVKIAAQVFANILESHVQVYEALKQMPGGKKSRIGILKNIFQIEKWHSSHLIKRALEGKAISYHRELANEPFYTFFTRGEFKSHGVKHTNLRAPLSLDFVGLNYYSRAFMKENWFDFKVCKHPAELDFDNPHYTVYPEGLYEAIRELSQRVAKPLNIPIYITENGIASTNETTRRLFFERYLYALSKAIADGHDVRGYITWSFIDNYSWGTYERHYGLIGFKKDTLDRTALKEGAKHFIHVANRFGGSSKEYTQKYSREWLENPTHDSFYSWVH